MGVFLGAKIVNVFRLFFYAFWGGFGSLEGPKMDDFGSLGGSRERKGDTSKTIVLLKENHGF